MQCAVRGLCIVIGLDLPTSSFTERSPMLRVAIGTNLLPLPVLGCLPALNTRDTEGLQTLRLIRLMEHFSPSRVIVRPVEMADPFILFPLEVMVTMRPVLGMEDP